MQAKSNSPKKHAPPPVHWGANGPPGGRPPVQAKSNAPKKFAPPPIHWGANGPAGGAPSVQAKGTGPKKHAPPPVHWGANGPAGGRSPVQAKGNGHKKHTPPPDNRGVKGVGMVVQAQGDDEDLAAGERLLNEYRAIMELEMTKVTLARTGAERRLWGNWYQEQKIATSAKVWEELERAGYNAIYKEQEGMYAELMRQEQREREKPRLAMLCEIGMRKIERKGVRKKYKTSIELLLSDWARSKVGDWQKLYRDILIELDAEVNAQSLADATQAALQRASDLRDIPNAPRDANCGSRDVQGPIPGGGGNAVKIPGGVGSADKTVEYALYIVQGRMGGVKKARSNSGTAGGAGSSTSTNYPEAFHRTYKDATYDNREIICHLRT